MMIKEIYCAIRYGRWFFGYDEFRRSQRLSFNRIYYDGWNNTLIIGKFWIEVYY